MNERYEISTKNKERDKDIEGKGRGVEERGRGEENGMSKAEYQSSV